MKDWRTNLAAAVVAGAGLIAQASDWHWDLQHVCMLLVVMAGAAGLYSAADARPADLEQPRAKQ